MLFDAGDAALARVGRGGDVEGAARAAIDRHHLHGAVVRHEPHDLAAASEVLHEGVGSILVELDHRELRGSLVGRRVDAPRGDALLDGHLEHRAREKRLRDAGGDAS